MNISEELTKFREQAANEIRIMNRVIDKVNTDPMLSELAKKQQSQTAYNVAHDNVALSYQREKNAVEKSISDLTQKAWGYALPGDLIIRRDADDRANRIEHADEAAKAYERSEALNDPGMLKALAYRAYEMGWTTVTEKYHATKPDVAGQLSELASLKRLRDDPQVQFIAAMNYSLPTPLGLSQR
jgi:hypothetical protein